jgi:hypothetical protein
LIRSRIETSSGITATRIAARFAGDTIANRTSTEIGLANSRCGLLRLVWRLGLRLLRLRRLNLCLRLLSLRLLSCALGAGRAGATASAAAYAMPIRPSIGCANRIHAEFGVDLP